MARAASRTAGKRKPTSRKPAPKTTTTAEAAPIEVMLHTMRFAHEQAGALLARIVEEAGGEGPAKIDLFKEMVRFRAMAHDAAKDVAPYIHPRLATVQHSGDMVLHHEDALGELE